MRPIAPLGLLLLLSACTSLGNMFGNPFDGFGGFFGDTVSFRANPNRPIPESDNARRVMGQEVVADPVLPEPGNIWPGMPRSDATRMDIERPPTTTSTAPRPVPAAPPPMSSPMVPPVRVAPPPAPVAPIPQAAVPAPSIAPPAPIGSGTVVQTGRGGAVITTGNNGIMNYTLPSGASGRAIDNGNGTMTLIGTDGSVMSVPAPR